MNFNIIFTITLLLPNILFGMGCFDNLPLQTDYPRRLPKTLCEMSIEAIARDEQRFRAGVLKQLPAQLREEIYAKREQYKENGQSFLRHSCL